MKAGSGRQIGGVTEMEMVYVGFQQAGVCATPRAGRNTTGSACALSSRSLTQCRAWIRSHAEVMIEAPQNLVYQEYADSLPVINKWAPWIQSVEIVDAEKEISKWTLNSGGLKLNWLAQNTQTSPPDIIAWKSLSGLVNRGSVSFTSSTTDKTKVVLTIEVQAPDLIARTFDSSYIRDFVSKSMGQSLKNFRRYVLLRLRKRRATTTKTDSVRD
eukprot:Plantae.Rhodophyta-Purpureofilum_apyrenoidigerum.ctg17323.p1 GENE.Plantae.Rhodophyta-Purpureofilum_apyrenoidigerum.ctg17323~~Plantae.Rhodophyta-Purpureofilum_apyrenoidigerum.ctg17323.p1  ORF type:complete len:214 (+),score=28.80 Plantae.Rhodophyta-Purpureofilum_apyrenoidigerum.ctg17323:77-718(+)